MRDGAYDYRRNSRSSDRDPTIPTGTKIRRGEDPVNEDIRAFAVAGLLPSRVAERRGTLGF